MKLTKYQIEAIASKIRSNNQPAKPAATKEQIAHAKKVHSLLSQVENRLARALYIDKSYKVILEKIVHLDYVEPNRKSLQTICQEVTIASIECKSVDEILKKVKP